MKNSYGSALFLGGQEQGRACCGEREWTDGRRAIPG